MKKLLIKILKLFRLYQTAKKIKYLIYKNNPSNIEHRKNMLRFYSQFIQKGDLCFDVGANIGNRTEIFIQSGTKVICVEPQRICQKELNKLFGTNPDVTIIAKALGDKEGYADMAICDDEPTVSTMSDKWRNEGRFTNDYKWTQIQKIPVTTLDTLIEQYGLPKFCKIDVEGFELQVLKGLTKPIPFISFEFTREFFDDAMECINHLCSIGSAEFNCSTGESMELLLETWVKPDELCSKLQEIDNPLLWGDIYARFCIT